MQADPLIGRQLANYAIEREIGRGGMAVVYFGRDIRLNRPAAIKVMDGYFRDQPNYTARFLQEARMIASLRHEHILQVYYADDENIPGMGRLVFFAMEYIDGQNLAEVMAQLIKQHGTVPPAEILKYTRAVTEALDYAHSRGVVHRDVKPANILVSKDGRIVLSDFGLALDVQQGSIGEVFGSAHYIAPEQARRSSDAVPQSDLYSLGVILFEMLTGVVPFDDPSPTSVALQHITLPPPRPRDINPNINEELEGVLLKALAKKPEERYLNGADLMKALEDALIRMHPSLPTRRQIPLTAASQPGTASPPRPFLLNLKPLLGLSSSRGKILIPAASLALTACIVLALGAWFWKLRTPIPTAVPPTSPVTLLPQVAQTVTLLLPATTEPAATRTAEPDQPASDLANPTLVVTDTLTPIPAMAETLTPIPAVTETLTAQPGVTWTPKYAAGRKMILSWNDSSFYMLQVTGYGELIDPLVFERLGAQDVPSNRFSGKQWSQLHASTLRDWCMRLEIGGPKEPADLPPFLRPAPCTDRYLATRYPAIGDPTIFWTRQEGSSQFRVLWGRDEIQRCEIDAGTCEVYLP